MTTPASAVLPGPSAATASQPEDSPGRLAHFPVTFFATGMGMMGLTLAFRATETAFGHAHGFSTLVLAISAVLLALVFLTYGLKLLLHRQQVVHEWHHPVRIAFFPAISISLLLFATAASEPFPAVAQPAWMIGTALQGILALSVISAWIGHRPFQVGTMTPAWFIPAVGNVIVPLLGAKLGYTEISWLFFSGGLVFWVVLLTLVMNRLMFHDPLPGRMLPTLMILIAPPAVAFVSWTRLTGEVGPFGHILLSSAYVFAAIVLTQAGKFRSMAFAMSWWALSFPLAALTIASFTYANLAQSQAHRVIGAGLVVLLTMVVANLIVRTLGAMWAGKVCVPE